MKKSDVQRISINAIEHEVMIDIEGRSEVSIEKLKSFHYNIIIEDTIRTSSFRYTYARTALVTICNVTNDKETLNGLNAFHSAKVRFEINNPVKKEDVVLKRNRATIEERRSVTAVSKKAVQMPRK